MNIQLLPGHAAALEDFFNKEGQRLKLDHDLARTSILGLLILAYKRQFIIWLPYSKPERFFQVNTAFIEKIKSVYFNQRKYIIDDVVFDLAVNDFINFIDHMHDELQPRQKRGR